ncbi:uncharacterized protein LOC131956541 [Physella acuta]|uniref:uncharacterized protein LOC131956541 n=1 Tax=Physella acuta TaxID=109671 RepID=UPI0027DAC239|nr:uncharacterized protein LOC131956541 [Physella acuta]
MADTISCSSFLKQSEKIDWLYPDLLSKDGLIHILRKRYIGSSNQDLENLNKESLVELYNCYILPLPQRKYRNNRRGQSMTREQILATKRHHNRTEEEDPLKKKQKTDGEGASQSKVYESRLKPPPCKNSLDKKLQLCSKSIDKPSGDAPVSNGNQVNSPRKRLKSGEEPSSDNMEPSCKKNFTKISWP